MISKNPYRKKISCRQLPYTPGVKKHADIQKLDKFKL